MVRVRTGLSWLARALVLASLAHVLGTVSLAYAVAHAPNGAGTQVSPDPCPAELAARGRAESGAFGELSTWVVEPPGRPRGTVVLLHGVRLDKRSMLPAAETFLEAGHRVVLLDLRGHGHSAGGHLTYGKGDAKDVSLALDALEARGTKLGPIGLYGFSYGAATALELSAVDARVSAVVAVASFASLETVVHDYVRWQTPLLEPWVPRAWLGSAVALGGLWAGFDPSEARPEAAAARACAPTLLIHGSDDPQVPADNARAIERAAAGRARLVLLPGETHASALADARGVIRASARRWFEQHLSMAACDN